MRIHPVFHVSRLEKTKNRKTSENPEVTEEEFEVEEITDKRIVNGTVQYKIRWRGYSPDQDTWEPEKNLNCPERVRRYENSLDQQVS